MAKPLRVGVVSADREVWAGEAVNVIARTTEGDIGILPGHAPLIAVLVACAVEIVSADGSRQIIAVDGGFLSVHDNNVSILSQYATLAEETSADEAQRELDRLMPIIESGEAGREEVHLFHLAEAQVKAAKVKKEGRAHSL